ncbi:hypothetical protein SAMN05444280_1644 [Tangfeifania diversioriginum]|uniref:Uncharacterized protein n=1 Tax=Tangfeifania diversioriginum TaxID=1168035 RepID=A0A1M6PLR6_9BACT|nr:hypothetical protein SAMN05444280_1644 [Tangfeifania diversioriginum]
MNQLTRNFHNNYLVIKLLPPPAGADLSRRDHNVAIRTSAGRTESIYNRYYAGEKGLLDVIVIK